MEGRDAADAARSARDNARPALILASRVTFDSSPGRPRADMRAPAEITRSGFRIRETRVYRDHQVERDVDEILSEQLQIPAALRENHRLASSRRRFRLFRLALREFTHGRLPLSLDGRLTLRVHLPRAHLEVHERDSTRPPA